MTTIYNCDRPQTPKHEPMPDSRNTYYTHTMKFLFAPSAIHHPHIQLAIYTYITPTLTFI